MKYPFTPEILDTMPEKLAELYRELEITLLTEICSRLGLKDELNEVTVQYIRALRSHGIDLKDIKKAIARTKVVSKQRLEELLDDVVERNKQYYGEVVKLADVTEPEKMLDAIDVAAIRAQTLDEFSNITRSMGFLVDGGKTMLPPAKAYQWALDRAEIEIESGAFSYNEAIIKATKQLADSGLKYVNYESGHVNHVDVAVRRAVLTGIHQINAKYADKSMDILHTDLVEVSAHAGARDIDGPNGWENHKKWQGKIYRWKLFARKYLGSSTGDYPDFEQKTGLGDVTGIEGANCRHNYSPFVEGVMERTYTDEQLAHIDDGLGCNFEGRHYTAYEATQKQRQIETTIRKLKRQKAAQEALGLSEDAQSTNIRIRRLSQKYKEFSKAAGLPEQRDRMKVTFIDEKSKRAATELKLKRDAENPIRQAIKSGEYSLQINPDKQARHMASTSVAGKSVITISEEELQEIITANAGRGKIEFVKGTFIWTQKEIIDAGKEIGYTVNRKGDIIPARSLKIHYSRTGVHAVPRSRGWKK